jgi:DNA mismatch endonuclease, patch repair protein
VSGGRRTRISSGPAPDAQEPRPRRGVPRASSDLIQQRMRATKRRDTRPELALRSQLHRLGLRFFVDRPVGGTRRRADIVFPRKRVAVYMDGCYWHGCPTHGTTPKQNTDWWIAKLTANRARDEDTVAKLCAAGWTVLRFWEHDDPEMAAAQVASVIQRIRDDGGNSHRTRRTGEAKR